ncbi:uncharacterized protein LOC129916548 [Episyrphus balteatus]|uniref:uncharacterized protein LOC129916548 n=1 Tax=Episyrphus balteatus TaxID=286459 RepID=UPI0024856DE3|nr:uncharacterized protein LOC129916548 [Episyrphus balteatus]
MQIQALFFVLCGILSVKGTPFIADSSVDLFKFNEVKEQQIEVNSNNLNASTLNSNETLEVVKYEESSEESLELVPIVEQNHIKSEHNHGPSHGHDNHGHGHGDNHGHGHEHGPNHAPKPIKQMGPVELGLRNVVSSSAIATEELFMEMVTLSAETSESIRIKSELLTARAMNDIFRPLNLVEGEIKKTQECGKQYVEAFNEILVQVNSNLKTCVHNLTLIDEGYKNQSTQILSSLAVVVGDIQNLPDSCEIAKSFPLGTFCIVNNLAEVNNRVVLDVKNLKFITAVSKDVFGKAVGSTVACHKRLVEGASEALKKLYNEVEVKCVQPAKAENKQM